MQTHTRACTNTYNHTHRSTQTYNHIDILERKLRVHTLIQRQTDQILSSPACLPQSSERREERSVAACCSRWLISSSSSSSSLPLIPVPPVEEDTLSPKPSALPENQGCRSFIMKGAGHLKLKFVVRVHGFSCAHAGPAHHSVLVRLSESESRSDTDGGLSLRANYLEDPFLTSLLITQIFNFISFLFFPSQKGLRFAEVLSRNETPV